MPQMMPLSWMNLFIYFSLMYFMMLIMMHFFKFKFNFKLNKKWSNLKYWNYKF